ncbi:MAG: OB-fold nucleic acid binding domain-containing protein, partial [Bacilli bacterium]
MELSKIKREYNSLNGKTITLQGWVRNNRSQKQFGFIDLNDGSTLSTIQLVYEAELPNYNEIEKIRVG